MKQPSQNQFAYEQLKRAIITLRLQPGSYLNEAAICAELNLSRTPVHHALHRLMHEGLVSIVPRKGVLVCHLSMNDFLELCAARRINEPVCAARAAERITEDELQQLADIQERIRATCPDNLEELITLDRAFHAKIALAAHNRVLAQVLNNIHDRSMRFWALALKNDAQNISVLREHDVILHHLRQHDSAGAAAAIEAHISTLIRSLTLRKELSSTGRLRMEETN